MEGQKCVLKKEDSGREETEEGTSSETVKIKCVKEDLAVEEKEIILETVKVKRVRKDLAIECISDCGGGKTIDDLPDELLVEIFCHLPLEDLALSVRNVCRRWSAVANERKIFQTMLYKPSILHTSVENIIRILQACPKLQRILLGPFVTHRVLETICQNCKDLREIDLHGKNITMIEMVIEACPNLERIHLQNVPKCSINSLTQLDKCRALKTLSLGPYIFPSLLCLVAEYCPVLENLYLWYQYSFYDMTCFLKKRGSDLMHLSLYCCISSQCVFPLITEYCIQLQELCVHGHEGSMESIITFFLSRTAVILKKLELRHCNIFSDCGKHLTAVIFERCHNLRSLTILTEGDIDKLLPGIGHLINLQCLDLRTCGKLTDRGMTHVVTCKKLKKLDLSFCSEMTEQSFILCCQHLPDLHTLKMNYTVVSSKSLLTIPNRLRKLTFLVVAGDNLRESIGIVKSHMPWLKVCVGER